MSTPTRRRSPTRRTSTTRPPWREPTRRRRSRAEPSGPLEQEQRDEAVGLHLVRRVRRPRVDSVLPPVLSLRALELADAVGVLLGLVLQVNLRVPAEVVGPGRVVR